MTNPNSDRIWKFISYGKKIPKGEMIPELDTPCWNWIGVKDKDGYGQYKYNSKQTKAHRFMYEMLMGLIPKGKQINHICRNRGCVNPEHLEPVTSQGNTDKGIANGNVLKTHCPKGHPYSKLNTYIVPSTGNRICRMCMRVQNVKRWQKQKEIAQ